MSRLPAYLFGCGLVLATSGILVSETPELGKQDPGASGFSIRRLPMLTVRAAQRAQIAEIANAAFEPTQGCFVAVDDDGGTLATSDPDEPLIPASTIKVFTGVAALKVLGPERRLTTELLTNAPVEDGSIETLWVRGGGDPSWATSDFIAWESEQPFGKGAVRTDIAKLVALVTEKNITKINSLRSDDSRLQGPAYLPEWKASYRAAGEVGPIGALSINRGLENYRGTRRSAEDAGAHFLNEFANALRESGIEVLATSEATAPDTATVFADFEAPPLADLTASMLRTSDNLSAEILLRLIGAEHGDPTTLGGAAAALEVYSKAGIPTGGLVQRDGSGLARENQVTCSVLLQAMRTLHSEFGQLESLSIAGTSGTLAGVEGVLAQRLVAKTGSLNGVSGLTGVLLPTLLDDKTDPDLLADDPETVTFALIFNGDFGEGEGVQLRLDVLKALVAAQELPDASSTVLAP